MKKLLLPILLLLLVLPAISQNIGHVSGYVTELGTGNPIANQAVTISNDTSGGWFYNHTVYTFADGYYVDTIPFPNNTAGNIYVRTFDCQNNMHQAVLAFMPSNVNFTVNFSICYNNTPCSAYFYSSQSQPLDVQFTDASTGGGTDRQWDFGDGTTSTQMNPVHHYSAPGYYNVSLAIGALGTPCYNTIIQTINVWDTVVASGCQASFIAFPDSNNLSSTYQFISQSTGNINAWSWNFGDPASGTNNTSTLENPTHTYSAPGTYTACLTVHGADTSCYDMTCNTIAVAAGGGCNALFTYYGDTLNTSNTVHFTDLSTSGPGSINKWVWNFGDGTVQAIAFPGNPNVQHTYVVAGTYNVCLSIYSNDSTCYDSFCQLVTAGNFTPCQAAFTYYSDSTGSGNTIHFIDQSSGNIVSWNWDFGDGTVSVEQNPVHTYGSSGYFMVTLTVGSPNQSCFSTIADTITAGGGSGCQAYFSYATSPAPGNKVVTFTDLSSGSPTAWLWSFGDGTSGNVQNPVHTYAAPGSYTVCLTISGNNCTSTFCKDVLVPDSTSYQQVYGQVFAGNFPLTMGLAMIFSMDTVPNAQPYVAVCPIDSVGVYYFTQVPDGSYYIMAIPFDTNGYLPTYYGNTISWELATLITLGTPNNPYNINLVAPGMMSPGPGSTSGQINTGDVANAMLDKINMILMNEQGTAIGYAKVSTAGVFSFPSLAYGTYYLHAEMPGVTSDMIKITLTPEKPHADVVMTFSGHSILGIRDEVMLANEWSVYPNPVVDNLTISVDMKKETTAEIGIYNMAGVMVTRMPVTLNSGNNSIRVSTASLPVGVYTMQVRSAEGLIMTSRIVKTR
jgi:PKD repeat protein